MKRLLPFFALLSGCSIVLVDDRCDTATEPDANDTGFAPQSMNFIDIGAGATHTCGILAEGTIKCWGNNDEGQLDAPSGQFETLSVGHAHSCALDADGAVSCWGRNDAEQAELFGNFTAVTAGGAHTCGLGEDGTVSCTGQNDQGQLNAPEYRFTSIAAGATHTCGIVEGGEDGNRSACWGSLSKEPEMGEAHEAVISGTDWSCAEAHGKERRVTVACLGSSEDGQHDVPAAAISGDWTAGARHGCALNEENEAVCWGANDAGQLDSPEGEFIQIASGPTSLHTCARSLPVGGELASPVTCWGLDAENQLMP